MNGETNLSAIIMRLANAVPVALVLAVSAIPAFAGQWILDTRSSCRVWNLFPLGNEQVRWLGPCKGGKAHGLGKLYWTIEGRQNGRYEGRYVEGMRDGRGAFYFANGNIHRGLYKNDLPNGHGQFIYASGDRYEGDFKNGAFHGKGAFYFHSGDRYVGSFVNNVFHGQGTFTRRDGQSLTGTFAEGRFMPGQ
jgi:hypothetical protein